MQSLVVSIHDVMPRTLASCLEIVALLRANNFTSPTLLVVPGLDWKPAQIDQLRALQENGAILAGHGWKHATQNIRRPYHKLHSMLISRDVAEHLALDADGIRDLIERCHQFFVDHDLAVSDLYVPPAWAMGPIRRSALAELPFRYFETLGGVIDAHNQSFVRSPMIGFEADTPFRAVFCRIWNRLNMRRGRSGMPIRMAIHPQDLALRLADDLQTIIRRGDSNLSYAAFANRV